MSTTVDPAGRHRNVYTLRDVVIRFYRDSLIPGKAPSSWGDANYIFKAIATGFTLTTKQDAGLIHGQGSRFPVATRIGEVSYEWSIDCIYTNDVYSNMGTGLKLDQFIEADVGYFAMQVTVLDLAGSPIDSRVFTFCTITEIPFKVSEGECVTCSLSGLAEWVSST